MPKVSSVSETTRTKAVACQKNLQLTDLNMKKMTYVNHIQLSSLSQFLGFFFSKMPLVGPLLHHICPTLVELVRMAYENTTVLMCRWNIEGQRGEDSFFFF